MTGAINRDQQDALAALDRLVHRHKLMTMEQAKIAARAITGDDAFEWPPPAPPATEPAPQPAAELAEAPAPAAAPESNGAAPPE